MDYKGQNICNSSLYHKWYKNQVYKIDLSKYFTDPDNNNLTFSAKNQKDFTIEINGNIAEITPNKDFTGVNEVIFIAKDTQGLSATSSRFVLHVVEKEPFSMAIVKETLTKYWFYILEGIAIIIFVIVIAVIIRKRNRKLIVEY